MKNYDKWLRLAKLVFRVIQATAWLGDGVWGVGVVDPDVSEAQHEGLIEHLAAFAWSMVGIAAEGIRAWKADVFAVMVQSGAQCTMTSPPATNPAPNIRLTISVTPEVHEVFSRLAKAGGASLSKTMGDWLGDTVEAAEFMAEKIEQARAAPQIVMREMHAYAMGLADEMGVLIETARAKGREARAGSAGAPVATRAESVRAGPIPPSGNTGGKGPRGHTQKRRG